MFFRKNFRNIVIVFCALIRVGLYGFALFPVLDDWIQYGTFGMELHPWRDLFIGSGFYTFRPIAWLFDIFIWCRIPSVLPLIIVMMHALSCVFLLRVARKSGLNLGVMFVVIYMFLPINSEATMWMSAATRLIVPVFFTSIALNLALAKRSKRTYIFFWLTQLLSIAFYEQVAIISAFLCILIGLRTRRRFVVNITFANITAIAVYYVIFLSHGPALERAVVGLTFSEQISVFWNYFLTAWGKAHWELFRNGFSRGVGLLYNYKLYAVLIAVSSIMFTLTATDWFSPCPEHSQVPNQRKTKIIIGIILFVLPYLPFLVLSGNMLAFRNCFPSLIGLALILDGLIDYLPAAENWKPMVAGMLVLMFMVVGVSELSDYRAVSQTDRAFTEGLLPQMMQEWLIMDRIPTLVQVQNTTFCEHILSVSSSSWAITGCARFLSGNLALPTVKVIWHEEEE